MKILDKVEAIAGAQGDIDDGNVRLQLFSFVERRRAYLLAYKGPE